mmetsp:Transcript_27295/g.88136  ORF Transcript_27295/g.88136 Transcript_27295/m.88136 type:complete len:225 (-) Transcript_27295:368-1042(-)
MLGASVRLALGALGAVGLVDGGLIHPKLVSRQAEEPHDEGTIGRYDPEREAEHDDEADTEADGRIEGDQGGNDEVREEVADVHHSKFDMPHDCLGGLLRVLAAVGGIRLRHELLGSPRVADKGLELGRRLGHCEELVRIGVQLGGTLFVDALRINHLGDVDGARQEMERLLVVVARAALLALLGQQVVAEASLLVNRVTKKVAAGETRLRPIGLDVFEVWVHRI